MSKSEQELKEKLEEAIYDCLNVHLHNHFQDEEFDFTEAECISGNAGDSIMGEGGNGVNIYVNHRPSGDNFKIQMPMRVK